ncbi:MAG: DUF4175 family protein [Myxococcota bacterium]
MSDSSGLLRLSALWQAEVGRRARRLAWGVFTLAVVVAGHLGRHGTLATRASAGALVLLVAIGAVVLGIRERRLLLTPRGVIRRVLGATNRETAARALRAHELVSQTETSSDAGSPELAALHFRRVIERVTPESVRSSATRRAARLSFGLLGFVIASGVLTLPDPMRVMEGLDVVLARRGMAPISIAQLEMVRITSQPPSYLHESEHSLVRGLASEQPEGSMLNVRGVPLRSGRRLVLTDGKRETDFVDDGAGGVVARFKVEGDAVFRVAARFGDVLIPEEESLEVHATRDEAPRIALEGAPRTLELDKLEGFELRYVVSDDHGLRQVDLVLRSGSHEDRRSLVKLDGQSREEHGAHALSPRDPFLRRAFLPVIATIQARDNDPTHGAKWGESQAITILPPDIGLPQAQRYAALRAAERKLIALLDLALADERERRARPNADARERRAELRRKKSEAVSALREAVSASYGGLRISSGLSAFVLGQARLLDAQRDDPRRRIEDALLAFDAGLMALAQRDATSVAKRLGDVAEEVAEAARTTFGSEQRELGKKRFGVAMTALERGVSNLVTLGSLGVDVGSVAQGEIRRIRRAESANSFSDAELAARHLAARLRRPAPSFAAGGGGGGGVESGRGSSGGPGSASDADQQFDQLMHELQRLAEDHAEQIRQVDGTLSDASQSSDSEQLRREAGERAARLRERLAALPEPGARQTSGRAAAAVAREHMNAMAQNLERLSLRDAVENGKSARGQLNEAKRRAQAPESASDWLDENALAEASRELNDDLAWAERALENLKQQRAQALEKDLNAAADREDGLARRASNLSGRGEHSEAQLPEEVQESLERAESTMRQAARALRSGETDEAQNLQAEAQRLLEHASPGRTSDEQDQNQNQNQDRNGGEQDRGQPATQGSVPGANKRRRSEDFRRRVLEGLAKERRGGLAPAVERYAEGLLE